MINTTEVINQLILSTAKLSLAMKANGMSDEAILKRICEIHGGHETIEAGDEDGLTNSYCTICNQRI